MMHPKIRKRRAKVLLLRTFHPMRITAILITLIYLVFMLLAVPVKGDPLVTQLDRAHQIVDMINDISGTAIFYKDNLFLTAAHVCDNNPQVVMSNKGDSYAVVKMEFEKTLFPDLCIVTIDKKPDLAPLEIASDDTDVLGTIVKYSGYPLGRFMSFAGRVVSEQMTIVERDSGKEFKSIGQLIAGPAAPGISGAIVYNLDGKVVGMVTQVNKQGMAFMQPLRIVRKFLKVKGYLK